MDSNLLRNLIFGILGALIAWIISEPWAESHSYGRDMFMMISLGVSVWFFLATANYLYYRKFELLKGKTNSFAYGIIPLLAAIAVKVILTPTKTVTYSDDLTEEARVILLDVSGSMAGYPLQQLKRAVASYLEILEKSNSSDRISLITFSNDAEVITDFTNDYARVELALSSLQASGGTNMYDGLAVSLEKIENFMLYNRQIRGEIIMVSDGHPSGSVSEIRGLASMSDYPIFTIGAGGDFDKRLLEYISHTSGGKFYSARNMNRLIDTFNEIAGGNIIEAEGMMPLWRKIIGWSLLGLAIGIGIGLFDYNSERLFVGIAGGGIGGMVGAVLLHLIGALGLSEIFGRMLSFIVFACVIALFLWTVERLYRLIRPVNQQQIYHTSRAFK